jgi:hypothetical protein
MSSSLTSKKIIYRNELITLTKEISKRMENFEKSISDLKILMDSLDKINNEVINEPDDEYTLLFVNTEKENKDLLESESVLILKEELQEIKDENLRLKEDLINFKSQIGNIINKSVKEEIQNQYPQFQLDCSIC